MPREPRGKTQGSQRPKSPEKLQPVKEEEEPTNRPKEEKKPENRAKALLEKYTHNKNTNREVYKKTKDLASELNGLYLKELTLLTNKKKIQRVLKTPSPPKEVKDKKKGAGKKRTGGGYVM
jgi:hypothetical protein